MEKGGRVYIMTNKMHTVLYTGVTSDITGRVWQHKNKVYPNSFTANTIVISCFIICSIRVLKKQLLLKKQSKAATGKTR
jgi:putative endonuclease